MTEIEFRFNFILWSILNVLWGFMRIATVWLIFSQTGPIAGWTREFATLIVVVHSIFLSILWTCVLPSLYEFNESVRLGNLDFFLTKPVNTRFLVSTRYMEFDQTSRFVIFSVFLAYFMTAIGIHPTFISVVGFFTLLTSGVVIFYSLFFTLSATNIWFVNLTNLPDLYNNIHEIGKYPTHIFNGAARLLLFYFIPVAFIATFPVQALMGQSNIATVVVGMAIALIFLYISQKFWNFALKHYSSASS